MTRRPIALEAYEAVAERFATQSDRNAYNACYERPATRSLLPELRGKRVLDAGCGPGHYAEWLRAQGAHVIGFDVSPRMLEQARQRLGDAADLRLWDLERPLSFLGAASIDVIVCALVLDSIADWSGPLGEFLRVLGPDGVLVLSTGHPMCELALSPTGNYFAIELVEGEWPNFEHVKVPSYRRSLGHIFDALLGAGFVVERVLEPRPTEECKLRFPEQYEKLSRRPAFLHMRARRP